MVLNNVRSGPEALKAGKERTKESQVHSVVLDSELLPTGTPDSASLRADVRLVKIDTQVAPRHEPSHKKTKYLTANFPPTLRFLHRPTSYTVRQGNELCSCYPGCVALSAHVATSHLLREHMNQMEIASLAAVEAWVEAMLSTAPLSYICTRGLQDTLCVHAERRQKRIVGTKHRARPEGHFWTEVVTSI